MERVPDDLWRIVFAFAGPTPGAKQAAARAPKLDEFVEIRLEGKSANWSESWTLKEGVKHTRARLKLVHALQTVDTRLSADVDDAIRKKSGRVRVRRRGYDYRVFAPGQRGTRGDADDMARRDKILRPLSLAIPDLRIHMHSDEDGDDFERTASMHWWHARCGYDWWDFVFFAPPPEDYIF